jgi:hypothetical protein
MSGGYKVMGENTGVLSFCHLTLNNEVSTRGEISDLRRLREQDRPLESNNDQRQQTVLYAMLRQRSLVTTTE